MAVWEIEKIIPKGWFERRNRRRGYRPEESSVGKPLPPPLSRLGVYPNPPAMPEIREAQEPARALLDAAQRASQAWNKPQLIDALQSIRFWTNEIEKAINK